MSDKTPHLSIDYLFAGQANKADSINEGFNTIDAILNTPVQSMMLNTPPINPNDGDLYIVADSATDAWFGQENNVAYYNIGAGWRFIIPNNGLKFYILDIAKFYYYKTGAWTELQTGGGGGGTSIDDFTITTSSTWSSSKINSEIGKIDNKTDQNATDINTFKSGLSVDASGNTSFSGEMYVNNNTIINNNGALKINKNNTNQSAVTQFYNNWFMHAELGLITNDNFSLKTSPDGSTFNEAWVIDGQGYTSFAAPFGCKPTFATIVSNAITVSGTFIVITSPAASTPLWNINGGKDGMIIIIRTNSGTSFVIKKKTFSPDNGNIRLKADITIADWESSITLLYNNGEWWVISVY